MRLHPAQALLWQSGMITRGGFNWEFRLPEVVKGIKLSSES